MCSCWAGVALKVFGGLVADLVVRAGGGEPGGVVVVGRGGAEIAGPEGTASGVLVVVLGTEGVGLVVAGGVAPLLVRRVDVVNGKAVGFTAVRRALECLAAGCSPSSALRFVPLGGISVAMSVLCDTRVSESEALKGFE